MSGAFKPGDPVRVRASDHPGHHRTPLYIKGHRGVVAHFISEERNPETLAYGHNGVPRIPVYGVRFKQLDLWPGYNGPPSDTLVVDLMENWLEPIAIEERTP